MTVYYKGKQIEVTDYEVVDGMEYAATEAYYEDTGAQLTDDELTYLGEAIMWAKEAGR